MRRLGLGISVTSILVVLFSLVLQTVYAVDFSLNCTQYLKRAADANTVALAAKNIDPAIKYLEKNDITNGIVSIFLRQPENDVGYLYANLKACQSELANVKEDAGQLERSNLLMKLRETLLDDGQSGTSVTHPMGISIYPHNKAYFWITFLATVFSIIGFLVFVFSDF